MSTNGEVTMYTHFYCTQGYLVLSVPLIRCQRGWLDNFSPPPRLSSFVKPSFRDQGAAWSLLLCGVRRRASGAVVELDILPSWQLGLLQPHVLKTLCEGWFM